jgi:hypothetical protein
MPNVSLHIIVFLILAIEKKGGLKLSTKIWQMVWCTITLLGKWESVLDFRTSGGEVKGFLKKQSWIL